MYGAAHAAVLHREHDREEQGEPESPVCDIAPQEGETWNMGPRQET